MSMASEVMKLIVAVLDVSFNSGSYYKTTVLYINPFIDCAATLSQPYAVISRILYCCTVLLSACMSLLSDKHLRHSGRSFSTL